MQHGHLIRRGAAGIVMLGALVLGAGGPLDGQVPEGRFSAPAGTTFFGLTPQFAVSPDGRDLVLVATRPGQSPTLWVQPVRGGAARQLAGTEQASYPFWSPDGRSVGFFANAKLKRVDLVGGSPIVVCDAPTGRGGTWSRAGIIVFASGIGDPLRQVAASGGEVTPASVLDAPRENSHRWPWFLPDGRHVLYWAGAGTAPPVLKVSALDGSGTVTVAASTSNGAYAQGHVFHAAGSRLEAVPFDPATRRVTGPAVPVVTPVSGDAGSFVASFAVAESGALFYTEGYARPLVLTWFDRLGARQASLGPPGQYTNVSISPDGRRVAVSLTAGTPPNRDIWVIDVGSGESARLTSAPAVDATPVWSPDGSAIIFSSQRDGPYRMFRRNAAAAGGDQLVLESTDPSIATDWSRDGRFIAYTRMSKATGLDLWILPLDGRGAPSPLLQSPAADDNAMFSPDGRAIAYQSGASGRDEVYLRAFPNQGAVVQVSTAGGTQPRWRADGRELYYLAPDGSVTAVGVTAAGSGWAIGPASVLVPATMSLVIRQAYATSADGSRVLTPVVDQSDPPAITLVPAWAAAAAK